MKKCLGVNTPVIMFDGSIKMVQDIKINDLIMADDSTSIKILTTNSQNGELFKVITRTGDYYVINSGHNLTFKISKYIIPAGDNCLLVWGDKNGTVIHKNFDFYEDAKKELDNIPDFVDLPVFVCIEQNKNRYWQKHFQLSYTTFDFPEKKLEINPYTFGEILVGSNRFSNLKNTIAYFKLFYSKHIPNKYKNSSREQRLKILAGMIDRSGRLTPYNNYEIILEKSGKFFEDIFFIAKSLGLYVFLREKNIVCISCGCINEIPVLIRRKTTYNLERFGHLLSAIRIVQIGRGSYHCFEIEENKRIVLGNFIIT
jgi:hypothetical protein